MDVLELVNKKKLGDKKKHVCQIYSKAGPITSQCSLLRDLLLDKGDASHFPKVRYIRRKIEMIMVWC